MQATFLQTPFAHRTLHDVRARRPENSVSGAKAAIAAGYGLEIDLQLSSDGVPMVFHDTVLQRLTRRIGRVCDYSAAELTTFRLTHGEENIPTLDAFLDLVAGQVPMLLEIKDQDGQLGAQTGEIEQQVCERIRCYRGPVALMSFNPHSVAKCAKFAPDVPRGLVTGPFLQEEWPDVPPENLQNLARIVDYDRVGASFISHDVADLNRGEVARLRRQGAGVFCWTVRSAQQEKNARKMAQNITFEGYLA